MSDLTTACSNSKYTITWQGLIDQLHKLKTFRVHTGNINNYVELKLKRYANSAEELCACLDLQFKNLPEDVQVEENGMLLLADKKHRDTAYERDDLKITLKLFVENFEFDYIRESIDATLAQLKIDTIEQLILAFPEPEDPEETNKTVPTENPEGTADNAAGHIDRKWFSEVVRLWKQIETELIGPGKVFSVGVADFGLEALRALYNEVTIKPCVDHFNIEGCCVVPPELQNFARDHDIQLLTHNDPHPFPLKDVFQTFCGTSKDQTEEKPKVCCASFEPIWAARYTIWVRRRSLMAAKGYIVQFKKSV
ncbi:aldo/keto reductase family domain-containing protein [Ditylenchus destructor]|uniref:GCS light chain n=1 Tax=Ditylenchus destructor TaxID=166010 RepID=A0AAD4QTP2_9BILA|nr:aldo/keto reductase family domain-containing protein [Ditylenchus destructor]